MIYTIGHKQAYEENFKLYPKLMKKGKTPDYPGGCVFKTMLDAMLHKPDDYEVYGVIAKWGIDTEPNNKGYHNLITTSPLVKLT